MNFHDPQTREQMEREGWVLTDTPYYLIAQKGPPDGVYVRLTMTEREATVQIMGKTMTPDQALNAANAILEGVEG
mgnify:CR=1 FL=1